MLASLGWFAVLSESPDAVEDCLEDIDYSTFPLESERELWGLNHAEIARRVARRMHLPIWLQILVGHIDLTADSIRSLGGNPELVATVRTAMELVQRNGQRLQLMTRSHLAADLNLLRLDAEELPAIESRFRENDTDVYLNRDWTDPRYVPLLPDLLQACLGDRLLSGPQTEGVEREVDQLHQIVHQQERTEQNRLDDSRLASLAEFAAGAAHEINNPLAIVSGNAQSLLKCETDESRRESLHSIIRQANRIHGILTEVMQFARPTVPALRSRGLDEDLRQVIDQLRPLAESKRVSIEYIGVETPLTLELDPKQIQTVYAALLRNAIEAAPVGGWVRISLGRLGEQLEVRFEDNGPGMTEVQKRHAFDPFYSGRTAGRGRGFGLPIAWRLAREHGGEVRDDSQPGEPTRIVVRLPLHRCEMMPIRQSA
jgi:signal transduction histidine kinase